MRVRCLIALFVLGLLSACHRQSHDPHLIRVGTIAGPETALAEVAAQLAKRSGLMVQVLPFSDYMQPNQALANGSIDINIFQHRVFLTEQMQQHDYHFAVVGEAFLYPMGVYSQRYANLQAFPKGAKVGIPNDPSNAIRAVRLLSDLGVIHARIDHKGASLKGYVIDHNPKGLVLIELDAAELPRALATLAAAVINTNFATVAGLSLTSAECLAKEANSPLYVNVMVSRQADVNEPKIQAFVRAYHSQPVCQKAAALFGAAASASWCHSSGDVQSSR